MQKYQNFANGVLNGAINNSVTSIVVVDGSKFPSTGDFYVAVEDEVMKITARTSNTLTAVRGQGGTTAASHASGAALTWIMAAETIEGFRRDWTDFGSTLGSFTPGLEGRIVVPDDLPYIAYDDGTSFQCYGPLRRMTPPPVLSNWTLVNATTTHFGDYPGAIGCVANTTAGQDAKIIVVSPPATPYTVECRLFGGQDIRYHAAGLLLRSSADGKFHGIQRVIGGSVAPYIEIVKFTNPTTYNSSNNSVDCWDFYPPPTWFQIYNDGTNLTFRFSNNGYVWRDLQTLAKTHWLTNTINGIGIWCNATNNFENAYAIMPHWKVF